MLSANNSAIIDCMLQTLRRSRLAIWQFLFILLSTSWILAPALNHTLSSRTTLISEYETSGQPYSWLFRIADVLASLLLLALLTKYQKHRFRQLPVFLLLVIGVGMALDPIFTTNCHITGLDCHEIVS